MMLTDPRWVLLEPLVHQARRFKCGAKPTLSHRMFFEAMLYIARTGVPWRDLPGDFGKWPAVYMRFRRWIASGSLAKLFELLTANPEFGDVRRALIDSTVIRVHQHAAGAPRSKKRSAGSGPRRPRAPAVAGAGIPARSC